MKNVKVFFKLNSGTLFMGMAIPFLLLSCTSQTEKGATNQVPSTAQISTQPTAQALTREISSNKRFEIVPNEKVCMVNDKFMGSKQIPIAVEGIIYYGCCQMCVKKLQENIQGVRYSMDPLTNEKVDKATAVIVRNLQDETVSYFGSKTSADKFMNK